jgi:3-hydroxyisobutyrate dehydrogenase
MTQVGFIGLGSMGGAIAEKLLAEGVSLLAYDQRTEAVHRLVGLGASEATLQRIGAQCDLVLVCLPRSEDVKQIITCPSGLAETMTPGGVVVDMTTGYPPDDKECAQVLARREIDFADAPVSGGPGGARAGTLTIMVGCSAGRFPDLLPTLTAISGNVTRVGDIGAGHTMKLVNNLIAAASRLAVFEGVNIGVRCGLSAETCIDVLNGSTGRSYTTEQTFPRFLLGDEVRDQGFRIGLMLKDVELAVRLGDSCNARLQIGEVAKEMLDGAAREFGTDADMTRLASLFDDFRTVSDPAKR